MRLFQNTLLRQENAALHRSIKTYEDIIEGLRIEINRMTPAYLDSPYCITHDQIASRQQVKGGAYVFMEYCGFKHRDDCAVYPKVGR